MNVLALVPARGGSKGIPRKNVRPLAGRPLIAYTLDAARESRAVTRVVVSTDDEEIADVATREGADVPFIRPAEIGQDTTPMLAVIRHALMWLETKEAYRPDAAVILQPTSPLRRGRHIDESVALLSDPVDAVISVMPVPSHFSPPWQFELAEGRLRLFGGGDPGAIITRRQDLPQTFVRNGAVYVVNLPSFLATGSLYGRHCAGYVMSPDESVNIDGPADWDAAERAIQQRQAGR